VKESGKEVEKHTLAYSGGVQAALRMGGTVAGWQPQGIAGDRRETARADHLDTSADSGPDGIRDT
jgi:hypothetical protein